MRGPGDEGCGKIKWCIFESINFTGMLDDCNHLSAFTTIIIGAMFRHIFTTTRLYYNSLHLSRQKKKVGGEKKLCKFGTEPQYLEMAPELLGFPFCSWVRARSRWAGVQPRWHPDRFSIATAVAAIDTRIVLLILTHFDHSLEWAEFTGYT